MFQILEAFNWKFNLTICDVIIDKRIFQEKLLEVIQNQLESCSSGFPAYVLNAEFPEAHHASTHILLFTSALVPKALASILTSFVLATGSKVSFLFVGMFPWAANLISGQKTFNSTSLTAKDIV